VNGNKIVLTGEMKSEGDRIKGAFAIARDLAEVVKAGKRPDVPQRVTLPPAMLQARGEGA
jgi:hypothetical protein